MEYAFTFVVDGVDVGDDALVCALFDVLDAMLVQTAGQHLVTVTSTGPNAIRAAQTAVAALSSVAPAMRVLRLDRDLVGVADIADRTGRSRQNVTQWAHGERQSKQPFPAPDGVVGRSRVWLWSEVNTWLRTLGLGDSVEYPSRNDMAAIDYALSSPRRKVSPALELRIAGDKHEVERHKVARRLMDKPVDLIGNVAEMTA
jgi:hypothetical protein